VTSAAGGGNFNPPGEVGLRRRSEPRVFRVGPGGLIAFPANEPHRNWNEGTEPTVHLAINSPAPDPDKPFARPVGSR